MTNTQPRVYYCPFCLAEHPGPDFAGAVDVDGAVSVHRFPVPCDDCPKDTP